MTARILELHATLEPAAPRADGAAFQPGDAAVLTLHATIDGGAVRWPDRDALQRALGQDALVGESRPAAAAQEPGALGAGSSFAQAWDVQLLLAPGEHELGPFPLAVVDEAGAVLEDGEVPAVGVTLASALPAEVARQLDEAGANPDGLREAVHRELAPVRGPWAVDAPLPWLVLLLVILGVLALAGGVLAFAWWRRKRRKPAAAVPIPLEPAEIVARRRLAALRASRLLDDGKLHDFHVELADIVKSYLTQRLGMDFVDLTTHEVRQVLAGPVRTQHGVAASRGEIVGLLAACDLVKFARHVPPRDEALEWLEAAERIVERTTPPPVVQAETPSAPTDASTRPARAGAA